MDHLLRDFPTKNLLARKRSFFHRDLKAPYNLGGGVNAVKGVYQSLRTAQVSLAESPA